MNKNNKYIKIFQARCKMIPNSKWWFHESFFCKLLDLQPIESMTPNTRLTEMLRALQQKCSIDLTIQSQKNEYDIYITKYGRKEDFGANQLSAHSSSLARPRYFRKGVAVLIQDQINLMKAVTGIDKQHSDEDTMKRRQGSWKDWYNGNGNNNAYYRRDLKDIADEFQLFFHEFVQPWWNCALQNPESLFPNTFKYIEDHVRPVELKIMKKNQVLEGIQAGYDEMLKMHERSLTCPIIYLILVDSSRAPPLPTSRHSPIDRRP
jgi:hypothetical protein